MVNTELEQYKYKALPGFTSGPKVLYSAGWFRFFAYFLRKILGYKFETRRDLSA
jgi:hypothetical protein